MTLELGLSISAVFLGILSLVVGVVCYRTSQTHWVLLEFAAKQIEELEEILDSNGEVFEASERRLNDQACRIAWLESRVRQPKAREPEVLVGEVRNNSQKLSITEKRHRVLKLANFGQSTEKIAATLGMMPGEVELIINLNRVAI